MRTADRPHRQTQHHRRVPTLGLPRPRLEPGRHLALGPARAHRARAHPRPSSLVRRGNVRTSSRPLPGEPAHARASDVYESVHPWAPWTTSWTSRSLPGENHVEWTVTIDQPDAVVAVGARTATDCTTSSSKRGSTRGSAIAGPSARGCAESKSTNGSSRSTASDCSSRGPTRDPRGWRSRKRRRRELARDVRLAKDAGLDFLRLHAHVVSSRAVRRGGRGRLAAVAGHAVAMGLRARHPQAGDPPSPRAPCRCWVIIHRSSIWCGHNEPMAIDIDPGGEFDAATGRARAARAATADVEQDDPRPIGEARARAGGRHTTCRRPFRRAASSAATRRHRQPPLLRLVLGRRARLPQAVRHRAEARSVRDGVRRASGAGRRVVLRTGALARPRLGAPGPQARAAEADVRSLRASRRLRRLRRRGASRPSVTRRRS